MNQLLTIFILSFSSLANGGTDTPSPRKLCFFTLKTTFSGFKCPSFKKRNSFTPQIPFVSVTSMISLKIIYGKLISSGKVDYSFENQLPTRGKVEDYKDRKCWDQIGVKIHSAGKKIAQSSSTPVTKSLGFFARGNYEDKDVDIIKQIDCSQKLVRMDPSKVPFSLETDIGGKDTLFLNYDAEMAPMDEAYLSNFEKYRLIV